MNPTAMILVGLPCVGKTTTRNKYKTDKVYVYSIEDVIKKKAKELNTSYDKKFFIEHLSKVRNEVGKNLYIAIKYGIDIIYDQYNLSLKGRKNIIKELGDNYNKICWCILPPTTKKENDEWETRLKIESKEYVKNMISELKKSYTKPSIKQENFDKIVFQDIWGSIIKVETK